MSPPRPLVARLPWEDKLKCTHSHRQARTRSQHRIQGKKRKKTKTKCCGHPAPPPQILKILNRKLVFCFLITMQKRLHTILRWVQYCVARLAGPARATAPCPSRGPACTPGDRDSPASAGPWPGPSSCGTDFVSSGFSAGWAPPKHVVNHLGP